MPADWSDTVTELSDLDPEIVDWDVFTTARAELGPSFVRILGYFREDGVKSVAAIEAATHTLKIESRQFGAEPLGDVAEEIEFTARRCVETRRFPDELVADVVELRRLFDATNQLMEREMNPLMERRSAAKKATQSFGRI